MRKKLSLREVWSRAWIDVAAWAALVLLLVAWIPVTVYRCADAEAAQRAQCRIESTFAGLVTRSSLTVGGIASASASADGNGIRFLDGRQRVLYVRDGTGVVGSGMATLASDVQALAEWSSVPFVARQWPLAGVQVVLAALVLLALRILWVRDPAPDGPPSRGRPGLTLAFFGTGLAVLAVGAATTYSCSKAEGGGASCTIERRIAGLVPTQRDAFGNVARAIGGSRTERYRSDRSRFKKRPNEPDPRLGFDEELGNIELLDAQGRRLYQAEYRGAYGMGTIAVAERISIMANASAARPFTFWHVPFLAIVPATLLLLSGALLAGNVLAERVPRIASFAHRAAFHACAAVVAVGWALALLGRFPT